MISCTTRASLLLLCLAVWHAAPVAAKTARNIVTDQELARALEKAKTNAWAKSEIEAPAKAVAWIMDMSDEDLWRYLPSPNVLRALNVRFGVGCPVHGKKVFRKGGHYPWKKSREKPFKITCPVGGETYPSNDFAAYYKSGLDDMGRFDPKRADRSLLVNPEHPDPADPQHKLYVDDGQGWVTEKGERFFFVGYYVFWQRWQAEIISTIRPLGQAYLFTGDPRYARKCAVLLSRLASDYRNFDYRTAQAYHNGQWPAGINGRILDYIWSNYVTEHVAIAYDAIWPAMAGDKELTAFLAAKNVTDPRRHIEQNLLRVMADDIMSGFVRGNNGMHQNALAYLALAWDNRNSDDGPTVEQMLDWILRGGGEVEDLLWNGFYRDGHGGESSPGYSSGWCGHFYELAHLLEKLGLNFWSNPKLKKMADVGIDLAVAGRWTPDIGDSGSILGSSRVGWSADVQGPAFRHYGDPLHAKALHIIKARTESLYEDSLDDRIAQVVKNEGPEIRLGTRHLPGYGLAILESTGTTRPRGVSMYYGHAGGGHGHKDRLTLQYFDFGSPLLNDMGYPAHWLPKNEYWTSNSVSHHTVLVNQQPHATYFSGRLNALMGSPLVQLMDASAENVTYPGTTSLYRRTTALIDVDADRSYLVDVFRVAGGTQHDWSFHGPPFPEFKVIGADLTPQPTGTLAGPDVDFAQPIPPAPRETTDAALLRPASFDGVIDDKKTPYDQRSLNGWAVYDSGSVLTRKPGAVISTSMTKCPVGKARLLLHAHDYNAGKNEITVRIAGRDHKFVWGESGKVGHQWIRGDVVDLPPGDGRIEVIADKQGQSYILLQRIGLTKDLDALEVDVPNPAHSGFNYLRNVRRSKPAGQWSATWSDPKSDTHLRLTMPAGRINELFAAQAEPELKPGHPDALDYVIARNIGRDLDRTYPVVIDAYRTQPAVARIEPLDFKTAAPRAVGFAVHHTAGLDRIISHLDSVANSQGAALEVTGQFAVLSVDPENRLRHACLIDGTQLKSPLLQIVAAPSPTGRVVAYDFASNTVTLDKPLPPDATLVGRTVFFFNDLHRTSYAVRKVEPAPEGSRLHLGDVLAQVGIGTISAVDPKAGTLTTSTKFTGYGRVDGGRHEGRWLIGETRSRAFKIKDISYPAFHLETAAADLDAAFPDHDNDGRRTFYILDVGPGDQFVIPNCTTLVRQPDNQFRLAAATDVTLTLPAAATGWSWQDRTGTTHHAKSDGPTPVTVTLKLDQLTNGTAVITPAPPAQK